MQDPENTTGKPSLSDAFNAAVNDVLADFPKLKGKFAVVETEEGKIHGIVHPAATGFQTIEQIEKYLTEGAQHSDELQTSYTRHDPNHKGLSVIFYNSAFQQQVFGDDERENALGVIDHEIGHILVPGGLDSSTPDAAIKSENKADLHAVLRKARREGAGAADCRTLAFTRAHALITDGSAEKQEHFTTFALLELAEIAKTTKLSTFTPDMAIGMADMLGEQYAPSAARVAAMAEAFAPCRNQPAEVVARKMAEITTAPGASDDVFKLGSFALSFYLKGLIRVHDQPLKLEGAYWDDVRDKIAAREAQPKTPAGLIIISSGISAGPS